MKKILTSLLILSSCFIIAQAGAPANPYYNGFNWTQTGMTLKTALETKIISTHINQLNYGQAENALRYTDLDPADPTNTNVLLVYGYSPNLCPYVDDTNFGTSADGTFHRSRNKNADIISTNECAWNREHIFALSLGNPPLITSIPDAGTDAHMLRTCDVNRNSARGNRLYAAGTGNSGNVGASWYPGDEWKGDVARILMYMYLHYGTQCLPTNVATGATVASDANMPNLLLQWNAEDPVSLYEDRRNTYLSTASNLYDQGNRNPFIDNPYLATVIWGGPIAQNRWPTIFLSTDSYVFNDVTVYPIPANDHQLHIESTTPIDAIQLLTINGQLMMEITKPVFENNSYTLTNVPNGFYFLKLNSNNQSVVKKVVVN
jgi:endonuclease I